MLFISKKSSTIFNLNDKNETKNDKNKILKRASVLSINENEEN